MKPRLLFKKTSTCRASQRSKLSNLNLDYLDETTKKQQKQSTSNEITLDSAVEYLTKEDRGQVHGGGFLHDRLLKMRQDGEPGPVLLDNAIRKQRIRKICQEHLQEHSPPHNIIAHKCVISMSDELHDGLVKQGIRPDAVLQSSIKNTMGKFQTKFHPGDRIGYAYGIHHDTDNLHAHVFLLSRTEDGERVGLSEQLQNRESSSRHKNQMREVKGWIQNEAEKWSETLAHPEKVEALTQKRGSEKYFFAPKVDQKPQQLYETVPQVKKEKAFVPLHERKQQPPSQKPKPDRQDFLQKESALKEARHVRSVHRAAGINNVLNGTTSPKKNAPVKAPSIKPFDPGDYLNTRNDFIAARTAYHSGLRYRSPQPRKRYELQGTLSRYWKERHFAGADEAHGRKRRSVAARL